MNYETECERALSAAETAVFMNQRDDAMWHCGRAEAYRAMIFATRTMTHSDQRWSAGPLVQRLCELEQWIDMTAKGAQAQKGDPS